LRKSAVNVLDHQSQGRKKAVVSGNNVSVLKYNTETILRVWYDVVSVGRQYGVDSVCNVGLLKDSVKHPYSFPQQGSTCTTVLKGK